MGRVLPAAMTHHHSPRLVLAGLARPTEGELSTYCGGNNGFPSLDGLY